MSWEQAWRPYEPCRENGLAAWRPVLEQVARNQREIEILIEQPPHTWWRQ